MLNDLDKTVKKMKWRDISLVKLSMFFVTLLILNIWPAFRNWVSDTNAWVFVILSIIFMARPLYLWFKR